MFKFTPPGKSRDIPGAGAETAGEAGVDGAGGVEPLIAGLSLSAQLGTELELVLVPAGIIRGILPVLGSSTELLQTKNNIFKRKLFIISDVFTLKYGMRQMKTTRNISIITSTMSATIPM